MTARQPKWKRKGYQSSAEYSAACRATRATKKAALVATNSRNKAREVLRVMWEEAEFDEPVVVITKEQLIAELDCSLLTVKTALKELREEGSIKPIYIKGGRGIPARYRLRIAGTAGTPSDDAIQDMKAQRDRDAAFRFLSGKYGPLKALEMMEGQDDD